MQKRTAKKISKKKKTLRERSARYVVQQRKRKNAVDRAIEFGVDITLLQENLKLTPAERLRKAQNALDSVVALRAQVEAFRMKQTTS